MSCNPCSCTVDFNNHNTDAVGSKQIKVFLLPIVQVAIERGKRPAPFRTRKLSLSSLMILLLAGVGTYVAAWFIGISSQQNNHKLLLLNKHKSLTPAAMLTSYFVFALYLFYFTHIKRDVGHLLYEISWFSDLLSVLISQTFMTNYLY
jgi:hypothetical protein